MCKKTSPNKSYYSIKKGKTQQLTFDSNITTGYAWFCVNVENEHVKFIEKKYIHPDTDLMGATGHEVWKFEGIKKGEITLLFKYPSNVCLPEKTTSPPTNSNSTSANFLPSGKGSPLLK